MNKRSLRIIPDFKISCFSKDRKENTLKISFLKISFSFDSFDTKSRIGLHLNFKSLMFNHFMKWNERTGIPKELALLERVEITLNIFWHKLSCEYFGIFYYLAKERLQNSKVTRKNKSTSNFKKSHSQKYFITPFKSSEDT